VGTEGTLALPLALSFAPGFAWNHRGAERADNLLNPSGYNYSVVSFPLESADMWDAQGTLRWTPNAANQVHASVSSRTHFPTIKDRYSYKLGSAIPNPDLQAERSLQVEVGYAGRPLAWLSLEANLWEAWITDAIVTVSKVGPAGESQSQNAGHVRNGGPEWLGDAASDIAVPAPELSARAALPWKADGLERLEISGSWSYLLRRDLDNASFRFVDQPRHKFYGSLLWSPAAPVDLVASATASTSRPGTSTGAFVAGGYLETDLLARWRVGKAALEAGLENSFDEVYALSEGYPEPGRTGFVRVRFDLK
jgi:iron complex outermembrane recepter protein